MVALPRELRAGARKRYAVCSWLEKFDEPFVNRAPVAQMDRACASEAQGQRFESSRARQIPFIYKNFCRSASDKNSS